MRRLVAQTIFQIVIKFADIKGNAKGRKKPINIRYAEVWG
jgi:hypothetical protein